MRAHADKNRVDEMRGNEKHVEIENFVLREKPNVGKPHSNQQPKSFGMPKQQRPRAEYANRETNRREIRNRIADVNHDALRYRGQRKRKAQVCERAECVHVKSGERVRWKAHQ